jgi:hypothetical protein
MRLIKKFMAGKNLPAFYCALIANCLLHWSRNSHNLIVLALESLIVVDLILRDNPQHDLGLCRDVVGNTGFVVGAAAVDRLLQTHDVEVREALTPKLYTTLEPNSILYALGGRCIAGVVRDHDRCGQSLQGSSCRRQHHHS